MFNISINQTLNLLSRRISVVLKGAENLISSEPPFKDVNTRFTLKALSDQIWVRY